MNSQLSEEDYLRLILKQLRTRYGVDFSLYRQGSIKRRLARRIGATKSVSYREYLHSLENDPDEYGHLLRDLTIKVSRFFRNRPVFEMLSNEILPDIMNTKRSQRDRTFRIWCAGCGSGEEVYSVAITLVEYLVKRKKRIKDYYVSIFGSDIDDEALKKARLGFFGIEALQQMDKVIVGKYFTRLKTETTGASKAALRHADKYQVVDDIRQLVDFIEHDVTSATKKSPPEGVVANYDLILCRNLLIYFSEILQKRALSNLLNSLNTGGYLILGRAETIPFEFLTDLSAWNPRNKIYKKKADRPRQIQP